MYTLTLIRSLFSETQKFAEQSQQYNSLAGREKQDIAMSIERMN